MPENDNKTALTDDLSAGALDPDASTETAAAQRKMRISMDFLRNISVGMRVWTLVGLAVVGTGAMGAVVFGLQGNLNDVRKNANAYGAIAALNAQLESDALQMRRNEKDFLLRDDLKYHKRYAGSSAQARKTLEAMAAVPQAKPLADALQSLAEGIDRHTAQFATVVDLKQQLGLDEKSGLQGALRKAVHDVEERLKKAGLDALTVKMLMMRRHEKDFMLRGATKYVDRVAKRQAEFLPLLQASLLPTGEQKAIEELLAKYVSDFNNFAATSTKVAGETKQLSAIFADMAPVFDKVSAEVREKQAAAQARYVETASLMERLEIGLVAGIIGLSVLIGFFVARSIVGPIGRITGQVTEIAEGNTDVEVEGTEFRDETGQLARALDTFRLKLIENEKLQAEQRELERKSMEAQQKAAEEERKATEREAAEKERQAEEQRQRTERMAELISGFDAKMTQVLQTVVSAATELQSSAESMAQTADRTNSQTSTVAAASEQASTNLQTVASAAEELSSSVQEISRQVSEANTVAESAVAEVAVTNEKVQGLSAAAQKIGEVVNLINDIASQTNLLALNATIEAARAGEAGKGFAVVATEVKSLADQTAKATEEISSQISDIQSATNEAVGAIDGISGVIGKISEISTMIASAVEEQGASTQDIASNVQQAAGGTKDISQNITEVSQATSETRQSADNVLSAANELSQQGELMRTEVDAFLNSIRAA